MKVIIAGGRDFNDYELLKDKCDKILNSQIEITIVSGGANGADYLGEKYAKEREYELIIFPADWNKYGKSAGPIRNTQMAENSDALIAFWDGKSKGTQHMINLAEKKGLMVEVYNPFEIDY